MDIGQDIIENVYSLKEKNKDIVVFIDQADLFIGMEKEYLKNFIETIKTKSIEGITFVMTMTEKTFNTFSKIDNQFENISRKMELPPLSYQHALDLIMSRLDEVRKNKKQSLEPFTEEEIKSIYNKSNGNPRLILLLCSTLYDKKMKFK